MLHDQEQWLADNRADIASKIEGVKGPDDIF